MEPLRLTLKGFRGIRDGLGLAELTLDLERLAGDAQLIAIAGPNGSGKTTVMDNLTPYNLLASRATGGGPGGFSYWLHVVSCGKQHCHWGIAGANGLAGRCLSLDMRR